MKDYTCKLVKNASLNCPDDFFTSFIVGLDPAQNGEFISRDQDVDDNSDANGDNENSSNSNEEQGNSKDVTETDQFVFTQEKVVKEPLTMNTAENGEEYGEVEDEQEEEKESSQEDEPQIKEDENPKDDELNDEEYDRMLADAVREAIRQQQESPLKLNLNVSLKAVTFLEILCQNNPERPIVWEVIFSLLSIGANPLGNI